MNKPHSDVPNALPKQLLPQSPEEYADQILPEESSHEYMKQIQSEREGAVSRATLFALELNEFIRTVLCTCSAIPLPTFCSMLGDYAASTKQPLQSVFFSDEGPRRPLAGDGVGSSYAYLFPNGVLVAKGAIVHGPESEQRRTWHQVVSLLAYKAHKTREASVTREECRQQFGDV